MTVLLKGAIVNLPIRLNGNLELIADNLLSLLGAQNKNIGNALQSDVLTN